MSQSVHLWLQANGEAVEGESSVNTMERENTIECFSFEYGVTGGSEAFSGSPSGVRNYEPIRVTKRVDKSSPLLWRALCNNEAIDATFKFYRPDTGAGALTEHFYTVEISEGRIAGIDFVSPDSMMGSNEPPTETISFVYNNMMQTYETTGAAHQDSFRDQG
ncbi:MAG: type VI secretion system tube protein TssD [Myxococcota bacterium]